MSGNPMDNGYILVSERHAAFTKDFPNGRVNNRVEHFIFDPTTETGFVTVRSEVFKDTDDRVPAGVGNASMPIPGPTGFTRNSEVENAETSALGRALAMIGYHPKETMASQDEINSKTGQQGNSKPAAAKKKLEPETISLDPLKAAKALIRVKAREAGISDELLAKMRWAATQKHSSKQFTQADIDTMLTEIERVRATREATGGEVEAVPA